MNTLSEKYQMSKNVLSELSRSTQKIHVARNRRTEACGLTQAERAAGPRWLGALALSWRRQGRGCVP